MKRLVLVPRHFVYIVGGGNANNARGINLHSYTKNELPSEMQKFAAFWKVHQRALLIAGKLSTFSILNAESFHLRWIDIHLGHSVGGCPFAIVAVSFETFKLFPINIAGTLHSRGSISRVNIGLERPLTLRDTHTRTRTHTQRERLLIQIDIKPRFSSLIPCFRNLIYAVSLNRYRNLDKTFVFASDLCDTMQVNR